VGGWVGGIRRKRAPSLLLSSLPPDVKTPAATAAECLVLLCCNLRPPPFPSGSLPSPHLSISMHGTTPCCGLSLPVACLTLCCLYVFTTTHVREMTECVETPSSSPFTPNPGVKGQGPYHSHPPALSSHPPNHKRAGTGGAKDKGGKGGKRPPFTLHPPPPPILLLSQNTSGGGGWLMKSLQVAPAAPAPCCTSIRR
jgi:hypothetical protein